MNYNKQELAKKQSFLHDQYFSRDRSRRKEEQKSKKKDKGYCKYMKLLSEDIQNMKYKIEEIKAFNEYYQLSGKVLTKQKQPYLLKRNPNKFSNKEQLKTKIFLVEQQVKKYRAENIRLKNQLLSYQNQIQIKSQKETRRSRVSTEDVASRRQGFIRNQSKKLQQPVKSKNIYENLRPTKIRSATHQLFNNRQVKRQENIDKLTKVKTVVKQYLDSKNVSELQIQKQNRTYENVILQQFTRLMVLYNKQQNLKYRESLRTQIIRLSAQYRKIKMN